PTLRARATSLAVASFELSRFRAGQVRLPYTAPWVGNSKDSGQVCAQTKDVLDSSPRPTLSIGRRQMRRGQQKGKDLKRGSRIRSAAKAKTRAERKHASTAALARKLEVKARELAEAHERETAASKVLQVISSSPSDLEPLFKTILENAT